MQTDVQRKQYLGVFRALATRQPAGWGIRATCKMHIGANGSYNRRCIAGGSAKRGQRFTWSFAELLKFPTVLCCRNEYLPEGNRKCCFVGGFSLCAVSGKLGGLWGCAPRIVSEDVHERNEVPRVQAEHFAGVPSSMRVC